MAGCTWTRFFPSLIVSDGHAVTRDDIELILLTSPGRRTGHALTAKFARTVYFGRTPGMSTAVETRAAYGTRGGRIAPRRARAATIPGGMAPEDLVVRAAVLRVAPRQQCSVWRTSRLIDRRPSGLSAVSPAVSSSCRSFDGYDSSFATTAGDAEKGGLVVASAGRLRTAAERRDDKKFMDSLGLPEERYAALSWVGASDYGTGEHLNLSAGEKLFVQPKLVEEWAYAYSMEQEKYGWLPPSYLREKSCLRLA